MKKINLAILALSLFSTVGIFKGKEASAANIANTATYSTVVEPTFIFDGKGPENGKVFKQFDIKNSKEVYEGFDQSNLIISFKKSKLLPKYELKVAELDLKGTGFYNVIKLDSSYMSAKGEYSVPVTRSKTSSWYTVVAVEKNNPQKVVDYFHLPPANK